MPSSVSLDALVVREITEASVSNADCITPESGLGLIFPMSVMTATSSSGPRTLRAIVTTDNQHTG